VSGKKVGETKEECKFRFRRGVRFVNMLISLYLCFMVISYGILVGTVLILCILNFKMLINGYGFHVQ
jgi:hypothetical protein